MVVFNVEKSNVWIESYSRLLFETISFKGNQSTLKIEMAFLGVDKMFLCFGPVGHYRGKYSLTVQVDHNGEHNRLINLANMRYYYVNLCCGIPTAF